MDWTTAARALLFFTLAGISLLALWRSVRSHERPGILLSMLLRILIWVPSSIALGLLVGWLFIWPDRHWIAFTIVYGIFGCVSVFMLLVSDITMANHAVNPDGGAPLSRRAATITCLIAFIVALAALLPAIESQFERLFVTFFFGLCGFIGGAVLVTWIEKWKFGGPIPEQGPEQAPKQAAAAAAEQPSDQSDG